MGAVEEGEEVVDGDRLDALVAEVGGGGAHVVLVEGHEHVAVAVEALVDSAHQVLGHDRLGRAFLGREGVALEAAARIQDVAEALGGDVSGLGVVAGDDRVGGDGGAVDDELDRRQVGLDGFGVLCEPAQALEHAVGRARRRRRGLQDAHVAVTVHFNEIGEGAADIDAQKIVQDPNPSVDDAAPRRRDAHVNFGDVDQIADVDVFALFG